jgi:acyl-CoA thioesterase
MRVPAGLAVTESLPDGFRLAIPEDWHQGRTAYGGLSTALALTAAVKAGGVGLPPLRSATVNFVGPLYGQVEVRARVLRRGKNATWISAELLREGECSLQAGFVFMGPIATTLHFNDRPVPAGLIAVDEATPRGPHPLMPVFLRNYFDFRFALPRSDAKQPETCAWVRLKDRTGLDAMSEILLIADALPAGVMPLVSPGTPISSMTWQVNLLTAAPRTQDGWWLLRSRGDYAENGCSSQIMDIWNTAGEPIASGMQAVALFG